jgi:hypothetical protein
MNEYTPDMLTTARLKLLYPDIARRALLLYGLVLKETGKTARCSESVRTFTRQAFLYKKGRDDQGQVVGKIVTRSKPGSSFHHFGCAFDSSFVGSDPYLEKDPFGIKVWDDFGQLAESCGLLWGGRWSSPLDRPHTQFSYGYTLGEIQKLYKQGGFKSVWSAFDERRGVLVGSEWKDAGFLEMGPIPF